MLSEAFSNEILSLAFPSLSCQNLTGLAEFFHFIIFIIITGFVSLD